MKLKVICWNIRRATKKSNVWNIIEQLDPDIALLQEVNSIPTSITNKYSIYSKKAVTKNGNKQLFSTSIITKGEIIDTLKLKSDLDWVNRQLEYFDGNLLSCQIKLEGVPKINAVSVYSPAWPINTNKLIGIDISTIKLKQSPELWCTEILWSALKNNSALKKESWLVSGDFNSSVTFDNLWPNGPHGNQEIIDRMNALGLADCLHTYTGNLLPTFKNARGGKIIHQLDHMYITENLMSNLKETQVGDSLNIFEDSLSDHLPIISEFDY